MAMVAVVVLSVAAGIWVARHPSPVGAAAA
jgi:hypothetical protein